MSLCIADSLNLSSLHRLEKYWNYLDSCGALEGLKNLIVSMIQIVTCNLSNFK